MNFNCDLNDIPPLKTRDPGAQRFPVPLLTPIKGLQFIIT